MDNHSMYPREIFDKWYIWYEKLACPCRLWYLVVLLLPSRILTKSLHVQYTYTQTNICWTHTYTYILNIYLHIEAHTDIYWIYIYYTHIYTEHIHWYTHRSPHLNISIYHTDTYTHCYIVTSSQCLNMSRLFTVALLLCVLAAVAVHAVQHQPRSRAGCRVQKSAW